MLALLTQCLAEKIFARQHSGTQHWGLSECEPCTLFPLLQSIHTAPHPTPPTLTDFTHTRVQHAWTHVCTFAHMQQGEWNAKWATWWKDTSTQTAFAYVGRGPFLQRDNVCVDFSLSAHFKHQKQQKEWGEEKKRSQTGMQSQPLTCSDLYKLSVHISFTIFYSAIMPERSFDPPALTKTYLSG